MPATLERVTRWRFDGEISGMGTASGTRLVVGHWPESHLGEFTDVMVEFADGHRMLIAPSAEVRDFVTATYTFDETVIAPVHYAETSGPDGRIISVDAGEMVIEFTVGAITFLGRLLSIFPTSIATAPWFCAITDPIARVVLRGVRTRGTAGNGRREYYGAHSQNQLTAATVCWRGDDLGPLVAVDPPVKFGFGSTPTAPSLTSITTTIDT